jgi:cysteine desulfurase
MEKEIRRVYLDNAATTPMDPKVFDAMEPILRTYYGNPSSIHSHGRKAKNALELARKSMAQLLSISPSELVFTSGGTEADNMVLRMAVKNLGVQHIISSPIEHHAVLNTLHELGEEQKTKIHFLQVDAQGNIDTAELESLLIQYPNALVSLMHGNNEIGNLIDLVEIGSLCKKYNALFHTDTVQTMGHYALDLTALPVDFAVGSAHKFNGPKGVGFLYVSKSCKLHPFITGGGQERGLRAGTENMAGIVGMAKALEISIEEMETKKQKIEYLKETFKNKLTEIDASITFNGNLNNSLYTVLNVSFPQWLPSDLFLFQLDILGISASGGSACSSGASKGSHVLASIGADSNKNHVRFSFGKFNQLDDIEFAIAQLKSLKQQSATS